MPKVVEVPGIGNVEFPDSMSNTDVATAIQGKLHVAAPSTASPAGGWSRVANAKVTPEPPGDVPQPTTIQRILASIPSPEQVLVNPESGAISRGLAGATLGLTHDVQEQAAKPITDPSRWFSPLTTPVTAAITGLSTSGLVSPENIQQGMKTVEALTPLMMGTDPFAAAAASSARTLSRLTIPGKIDKYLKLRGVRPLSVELPTVPLVDKAVPPVAPVADITPIPSSQASGLQPLSGEATVAPLSKGGTIVTGGKGSAREIWDLEADLVKQGKISQDDIPRIRRDFASRLDRELGDLSAPEKQAAHENEYKKFLRDYSSILGNSAEPAKPGWLGQPVLSPARGTQLLADRQLPTGQSVIIERPGWTQVRTTVKAASPGADRAAADMVTAEPIVTPKGTVDYGPIYDPATMGVEKKRLNTIWDRTLRYLDNLREKLPADPSIVRQAPNSWALVDLAEWDQKTAAFMKDVLDQPWQKLIHTAEEGPLKDAEARAVNIWRGGGKNPVSYKLGIESMPQELQDYIAWREGRFPLEDAARIKLGLSELDHTPGPYIARMVDKDFNQIYQIRKTGLSLAADTTQTIGRFQYARTFDTMAEGEAAQVRYIPMNHAILMREYEGMKLVETARLMDNLEAHRVIFRDQASAMANSPTNRAYEISGLPGTATQRWFASTKAEALLLEQNLSKAEGLGLGRTNHWLNLLFRNLNLINPLPHLTKNMLYKYILAGGKVGMFFRKVEANMREFIFETSPLVQEFYKYFPSNKFGETAQSLLAAALKDGTLEGQITKGLSYPSKYGGQALFGYLDPGLRYSLWKQKMAEGVTRNGVWSRMSPLEAANHVYVDLVRYGTRSDWVDFWKSIPMNFFVPWRLGSVTSVTKQLMNHPVKSMLKIGLLDYTREIIYRNTGLYFHMPIDYVTGPVMQSISMTRDRGPAAGVGTAATLLAASRVMGPGGAWGAGQLAYGLSLLSTKSPVEWDRIKNLWWGVSQVFTLPAATYDAVTNPTVDHVAKDLLKIAGSIGFGAHNALGYEPQRLGMLYPEWLPGLKKSPDFKKAEEIREVLKQRAEKAQVRRDTRDAAFGKGSVRRALKAAGIEE